MRAPGSASQSRGMLSTKRVLFDSYSYKVGSCSLCRDFFGKTCVLSIWCSWWPSLLPIATDMSMQQPPVKLQHHALAASTTAQSSTIPIALYTIKL